MSLRAELSTNSILGQTVTEKTCFDKTNKQITQKEELNPERCIHLCIFKFNAGSWRDIISDK